jgi:23S rRNA (cytosine1962-C5)-methyltransferase
MSGPAQRFAPDARAPALVLKAGREKSLLRRHPWVFSGAIERIDGSARAGDTIALRTSAGAFLASAAYSPESQIRARVWSFDERQRIDAGFFGERVRAAVARRARIADPAGAVRLVHGEADALPGVVCDRYGEVAVFQFSSAGAERWRDNVIDAVLAEGGCRLAF